MMPMKTPIHEIIETICKQYGVRPFELAKPANKDNQHYLIPCMERLAKDLTLRCGAKGAQHTLGWSQTKLDKYRGKLIDFDDYDAKRNDTLLRIGQLLRNNYEIAEIGKEIGLSANIVRSMVSSRGGKVKFMEKHTQ